MAERHPLDPHNLEQRSRRYAERSFLGGTRIGSRTGLLMFVGLVLAGGLGGGFFQLDRMVGRAVADLNDTRRFAQLAENSRREVANLRVHEKDFLLRKDPAASETLAAAAEQTARSLGLLYRLPVAQGMKERVATVRDGIAQYASHFAETVKIETAIGLSSDQGLRGQIQKTTAALEAKFREHNLSAAMTQLARVTRIGREFLLPEVKVDHALIEKNYETLRLLIAAAQIPPREKVAIEDLVKAHEGDAITMLSARTRIDRETRTFDEIYGYMGPGLEEIVQTAERAGVLAAESLDRAHALSRMVVAGGAGGTILFLVFFGALLLRSVFGPLRRVADAANRLAAGERNVDIPVRGNIDAVGHVARALDSWAAALDEIDVLRAELSEIKERLARALAGAASRNEPAPPPPVAVEKPVVAAPAPAPAAKEPELPPPEGPVIAAETLDEEAGGEFERPSGRFASASQKLSYYSRAVTDAARDVERTETLMRGLADATDKVIEMETLVAGIRDQANLIAFKTGVREARGQGAEDRPGESNLVLFSPDVKLPAEPEGDQMPRFDTLRDAVDKAERTARAVHTTLADITGIAQDIAAASSNQALEATTQLLSQSEYLHHMLDDVLARVQSPAGKGGTREKDSGRDGAKGDRKKKD
ncbi:MAG: HAMP domain-containing protein [Alphaproteobacteria bacterium]|nr:HAMP domain-containing protein [Alphaproteobacteria bacterium]